MGQALDALGPGHSFLFDDIGTVEIELLGEAMILANASDDALIAGANLALIGDELVQFGRATALSDTRYRLSHLLRGRRGTEWAIGQHVPEESFTLIEAAALALLQAPAGSIGGMATISATGVGDATPAVASGRIVGRSLLPPAPVHLSARRLLGGDVAIAWTRRSRRGWAWTSEADTPLGEERELYRLGIAGGTLERVIETATPAFLYDAAMQVADGAEGLLAITVRQAGDHGLSPPSVLTLD